MLYVDLYYVLQKTNGQTEKKSTKKKHNHTSRKSVDKESLNKLGITKAFIYVRG